MFVRNGLPILNQRKLIFSGIAVYVLGRMMDPDDCLNFLNVFCGGLWCFVVVYSVLWWFVVVCSVFDRDHVLCIKFCSANVQIHDRVCTPFIEYYL